MIAIEEDRYRNSMNSGGKSECLSPPLDENSRSQKIIAQPLIPDVSRLGINKDSSSCNKLDATKMNGDDSSIEMAPLNVSGVLLGGWRFPWSRSNSTLEQPDETLDERPSNESLLSIAFISFMGFTICQTVAAIIAGSEAMMGDSAAMFVDALTYLFNYVAERRKTRFDRSSLDLEEENEMDPERAMRLRKRAKRKMILQMELIPPLISVSTLVVVTAFVLRKAIHVLILDVHRDRSQQANPNVELMFLFSVVNLFLDMFNVFCFAKAKHALGYETTNEPPLVLSDNSPRGSNLVRNRNYVNLEGNDRVVEESKLEAEENVRLDRIPANQQGESVQDVPNRPLQNGDEVHQVNGVQSHETNQHGVVAEMDLNFSDEGDEHEQEANLNMCSAYTHVFADTLRSIAVVIAAVLAELVDGVTPEEADATAAVVVSGLILLSLIPLINGLVQTFGELNAIRAEEQSEKMFPHGISPTLYRMTREKKKRPNVVTEQLDFV